MTNKSSNKRSNSTRSSKSSTSSKRTSSRAKSSKSSRGSSSSRSRRTSSNRTKTNQRPSLIRLTRHQWAIIAGILLIATAGIAILSVLAISEGSLTRWMWYDIIWPLFGYGGILIPVGLGLAGLFLVLWGMEQSPQVRWDRVAGAGVLFLAIEGILHLFHMGQHPEATIATITEQGVGGGYIGGGLAGFFQAATGRVGAWLLCLAQAGVALVMISGKKFTQIGQAVITRLRAGKYQPSSQPASQAPRIQQPLARPRQDPLPLPTAAGEKPTPVTTTVEAPEDAPEKETPPTETPEASQPGLFYGDAVKIAASHFDWQRPQVPDILEPGTDVSAADTQIREQVEIIEHTLTSFGAPGRVVEVNRGPVITQYGVEPQYIEQRSGKRVKVKVGQINSLADDLALALAARSIRIEAPVPGKGYVGIEVPNSEVSVVSLRDVMESKHFGKIKSPLGVGLGQDVSGHAIAADLAQMPHLLVAGATGSGKSVCVNSMIACMLLGNTPDQLRMLMVDPKRVELTNYNGIPHLLMPVIVDLEKVVAALQWVTREMDNRYRQFAAVGARNIGDFNRQAGDKKLPFIVVIIDELADLMMLAPDETERTICRLAQMARATGIHLIIATQRPSVDVVTGLIKANFPARIAFAVASSTDSRVILDSTGAERLLGRGDMLFMSPSNSQPLRMQGCYVSDKELRHLVDFWRRQRIAAVQTAKTARQAKAAAAESTADELPADQAEEQEANAPIPAPASTTPPPLQQPLWEDVIIQVQQKENKDELLDQAIATVRELGKASVSLLQRRLRIGYTRAARLIDEMEAQGVVGPHPGGSRQREVLPAPETPAEE